MWWVNASLLCLCVCVLAGHTSWQMATYVAWKIDVLYCAPASLYPPLVRHLTQPIAPLCHSRGRGCNTCSCKSAPKHTRSPFQLSVQSVREEDDVTEGDKRRDGEKWIFVHKGEKWSAGFEGHLEEKSYIKKELFSIHEPNMFGGQHNGATVLTDTQEFWIWSSAVVVSYIQESK